MNTDKQDKQWKIVEYSDGFLHYFSVHRKTKFLWFTYWKTVHADGMIKRFLTFDDAKQYIQRVKIMPLIKTTYL